MWRAHAKHDTFPHAAITLQLANIDSDGVDTAVMGVFEKSGALVETAIRFGQEAPRFAVLPVEAAEALYRALSHHFYDSSALEPLLVGPLAKYPQNSVPAEPDPRSHVVDWCGRLWERPDGSAWWIHRRQEAHTNRSWSMPWVNLCRDHGPLSLVTIGAVLT